MSGLTPTGFVVETTDQILTAIEGDELTTMDPANDLSPDEPLGQLNGIFSSKVSDVWQGQQACYSAQDPNNAEGQQLDVVCLLTGTKRKAATSTVAHGCTGSGTTATVFNAAVLDQNGNVVTPGSILAQIAGHPEFVFTNRNALTIPAGGTFSGLDFICVQTGAIACNGGTLTVISPPVTGLSSITNPTDGETGSAIESDTALRIRRVQELVPPDGATNDSMRQTLLAVQGTGPGNQGVINAFVFENDTNATDGNGLPPHSTLAVIWDGASLQAANNDIAQAIWNSKSSGIQPFDANSGTSGVAIDSAGASHTIGFARATQLTMYVNITVAVDNTFDTVNGAAAVAAAIATMGNTLVQGQPVVPLDYTGIVRFGNSAAGIAGVQGVRNVTVFQIDSHSSPTNTAEIAVSITNIARFDTSRIAVSTTPFS